MFDKAIRDSYVQKQLLGQGFDPDEWELSADYSIRNPYSKAYRSLRGKERLAIVGGLPKVRPDQLKICGNGHNLTTVGWERLSSSTFGATPNLVDAGVVDGKISLVNLFPTKSGLKPNQRISWSPQLYLKGKEQSCGEATLLETDPYNENYHNNVLEWDYGVCKRHLRLIEGGLLGRWVFTDNPNGEVRIKYNQTGDFKLSLGESKVSDDEELIPESVFDSEKYPLVIADSVTVYSTASDGGAYATDATYATAHDAANADTVRAGNDWTKGGNTWADPNYIVERSFLYFIHGLASNATVSAVTMSVYDEGNSSETNADHADLGIFEGVQGDPFDAADYGDHLTKTTLGAASYYPYPLTGGQYDDLALNATGLGWVQSAVDGGTNVKLCLKVKGDIDTATPTGENATRVWASERGAGYYPKLAITYTVPASRGWAQK